MPVPVPTHRVLVRDQHLSIPARLRAVFRGLAVLPMRAWISIAVGVALGVIGCGSDTTQQDRDGVCVPGQQRNCECAPGLTGIQACVSDGSGYTSCESCAPSGNGGSGGGISVGGSGGQGGGSSGACNHAIDIVLVLDVSSGMEKFLKKLAGEVQPIDTAAKSLNPAVEPHYGLVVYVDDTLFVNSEQPYSNVSALQSDIETWATFSMSAKQTYGGGLDTTYPGNSMDALYRAAVEFPWRASDSSLRMVIHATDDTFWQGPATQDGVQIMHNYAEVTNTLKATNVRVLAFAAKLGGPLKKDDVSAGWFAPYQGMPSIPSATGGVVYDLDSVLGGAISLSNVILSAIQSSQCKPYPASG